MSYVDRFVCAVSTANREKYREHATGAAMVFKEHGAMSLVECWGDDVPDGKLTSFSDGGEMPARRNRRFLLDRLAVTSGT